MTTHRDPAERGLDPAADAAAADAAAADAAAADAAAADAVATETGETDAGETDAANAERAHAQVLTIPPEWFAWKPRRRAATRAEEAALRDRSTLPAGGAETPPVGSVIDRFHAPPASERDRPWRPSEPGPYGALSADGSRISVSPASRRHLPWAFAIVAGTALGAVIVVTAVLGWMPPTRVTAARGAAHPDPAQLEAAGFEGARFETAEPGAAQLEAAASGAAALPTEIVVEPAMPPLPSPLVGARRSSTGDAPRAAGTPTPVASAADAAPRTSAPAADAAPALRLVRPRGKTIPEEPSP